MKYQSSAGRQVSLEYLENELVIVSLILAGINRALETVMGDPELSEIVYPDLNMIKAAAERAAGRIESVIPDTISKAT
jgi:hypothetical protein